MNRHDDSSSPTSQARFIALERCAWRASWALLLLIAAGCSYDRASVGDPGCSDERVLCEPHTPQLVSSLDGAPWGSLPKEGSAEVVWRRSIPWAQPPCKTGDCSIEVKGFLVHDDGEIVLAGLMQDRDGDELVVAWLDADGEVVFQATVPGSAALLRDSTLIQLTLTRSSQGETLLLHGHGTSEAGKKPQGLLSAHSIARSGEIAVAFGFDIDGTWPGPRALLDADVVVGRTPVAPDVEIARYTRQGELLWRQTRISSVPGQADIGLTVPDDAPPQLQALRVDARGRIWAVVYEGVIAIVQLDPDGVVAWHAWTQLYGERPNTSFDGVDGTFLAIDSRDRPVISAKGELLRLEPDGSDEERSVATAYLPGQEYYYPPTASSLAIDGQDRIHIATQDGPRSARRIVIDRVSESFAEAERFAVLSDSEDAQTGHIRHMQIAANGDIYVHIHGGLLTLGRSPVGVDSLGDALANPQNASTSEHHYVARLRLPEP
jgi:hypothetical protein